MERILLIFVVRNLKIRQYLLQSSLAVDLLAGRIQEGQGLALVEGSADLCLQLMVAGIDHRRSRLFMDRVQGLAPGGIVVVRRGMEHSVEPRQLLNGADSLGRHVAGIGQKGFRLFAQRLVFGRPVVLTLEFGI